MRFRDTDFPHIQEHIDLTRRYLAAFGLTLHADSDMYGFTRYLGSMTETHGVPNTHDPECSVLNPANSFWLYVQDEASKEIIACVAHRLYITDDFVEECKAEIAFENHCPKLDIAPLGLYPEARNLLLAGRVVLGGGNYVRPDWRGKGLVIFTRASRSIALRFFLADYLVGMQLNTERRRKMALDSLAYAHVTPFIRGGLPGKPQANDVQLAYSSRSEWMAAIRAELSDQYDGKRMPKPTRIPTRPPAAAATANIRA